MTPVEQRRARLVARQLSPVGTTLEAARSVLVLHATDPATVYLSVLARAPGLGLADVASALYEDRALVRMMAMRRTLFVVPRDLADVVHHAAAVGVAATMRRRLLTELAAAPTDPVLPEGPEALATWLTGTEQGTERAMAALGTATGAALGAAEPRLRTAILPRTDKAYDVRRTITSQVLALLGAEGRLVRGRPSGSWTSRQHTWEAGTAWWPDGVPDLDPAAARAALVAAYLRRFGPASEADVAWWTGWALGVTRKALAALDTVPLGDGVVLAEDEAPVADPGPSAVLLPALDPTPMGWKGRHWFLPEDPTPFYDPYGNVGPTIWWRGEVVGGWAVRPDGTLATRLVADRGTEATEAVGAATEALAPRLEGATVVPSFPTPLERALRSGA